MYLDFGMTGRDACACARPKIIEGVKVVEVFWFEEFSIFPIFIAIVGIKHHRFPVVTCNIYVELDFYCVLNIFSLVSLDYAVHLLGFIDVETKLLPSRIIQ